MKKYIFLAMVVSFLFPSCHPTKVIGTACRTREVAIQSFEIGYRKAAGKDTLNFQKDLEEFKKLIDQ